VVFTQAIKQCCQRQQFVNLGTFVMTQHKQKISDFVCKQSLSWKDHRYEIFI